MTAGQQMIVGAAADFVGALGVAVTAAMIQGGQVMIPGKAIWILGVITGAMAAASHVKTSLTQPPRGAPAGPDPASGPGGGG